MTPPTLLVDGKPLPLGKRIGKGGEGEVFLLADDLKRAAKIYTIADLASREVKISAMVRLGLAEQSALVAFPLAIARDQCGRFKGFVMHFVRDHKPIFELYGPQARKQNFPRADYRFLTRAAINTARAVASVHQTGCVIGDINHSGILVSDTATVALIDADSFQIIDGKDRHLCRVGVPEYTPPELQGVNLASVVRTANHDAFGLAIAIFQLLTMGRHPFVGSYSGGDTTIQRNIAELRFAYSRERFVGMTPPPGVSTLDDLPSFMAAAFEAAFGPSRKDQRPTAAEWVKLLGDFEQSLQKCANNVLHYHAAAARICPWCRMELKLGMVLFLPKDLALDPLTGAFGESDFNLTLFWAQIEAIKLPSRSELVPSFPTSTPTPSPEAVDAKRRKTRSAGIPAAGIVIGLAFIIAAPALWIIGVGIAIGAFFLGRNETGASSEFRARFLAVEQEWNEALDQWEKRVSFDRIELLRSTLLQYKQDYEALRSEQQESLKRYQRGREEIQRTRYLENIRIRNYKIRGIGPAKLALLASYGIETAADATPQNVLKVPGFGPINSKPLFEWQQRCARSFVYNPAPNTADQIEISKIKLDLEQRGQALRQKLKDGAQQLTQAVQGCRSLLAQGSPALKELHAKRSQVEVDLHYLGIALPPRPVRTPPPPARPQLGPRVTSHSRAPTAPQPAHSPSVTSPTCPRCRSAMVQRVARRGPGAGKPFWGCSRYPRCRGTRPV